MSSIAVSEGGDDTLRRNAGATEHSNDDDASIISTNDDDSSSSLVDNNQKYCTILFKSLENTILDDESFSIMSKKYSMKIFTIYSPQFKIRSFNRY